MFTALPALSDKRISIENAVHGESYFCPVCGNPVVVKAANSDNIRTHFAHKRNTPCPDNWNHDMSDWHLDWQSKFPIENREIVIEKDGVFHRADVLINGTVIEFQHSPISSEEFEARNCFYKNCGYRIVWLFDVTDKMKIDDCFGLVWKRKTTLFSKMRTQIDDLFLQNYLPGKDNLLALRELDSKVVHCHKTICPIMPSNFLKEYGGIQDEAVLSIRTIFEMTKTLRELKKQAEKTAVCRAFDSSLRGRQGHHGRF